MTNLAWNEERETRTGDALQVTGGYGGYREVSLAGEGGSDRHQRSDRYVREGDGRDIHVTVSGGADSGVGIALKGDWGSNGSGGSQSSTACGQRQHSGGNQNWTGSRSDSWGNKAESSSVATNEERGRYQVRGRVHRAACSSTAGSQDGRSPSLASSPEVGGRGGSWRGGHGRGSNASKVWGPQGGPWLGSQPRGGGGRAREWREDPSGRGGRGREWREDPSGRGGQGWTDKRNAGDTSNWRQGREEQSYNSSFSPHQPAAGTHYQMGSPANEGARPSPSLKLGSKGNYTAVRNPDIQKPQKEELFESRDRKASPALALAVYPEAAMEYEGNPPPSIVGTCPDMCPAREREQRERLRDLAIFERLNGNVARTSAALAVKKFCRTFSSSNLHPSDVRPLAVLRQTLQYLLRILDRHDCTFKTVHAFLFDRTRAVRQELGMQGLANSEAINMFEEIVRFHIMSERELQEQTASTGEDVDSHLNFQQLSKSLLTLLNLYRVGESTCQHEGEFHSYYVLLNLGDREHYKAEPLSLWFRTVPAMVLQAPDVSFSRSVLRCYRSENYRGFFQLAKKATYLQGCLMELYFGKMRGLALEALNQGGYKLHPYPMADIARLLLMKESDTDKLCISHGLATGKDKVTNAQSLLAKQATFTTSKKMFRHQCSLINDKRAPSYFQEVTILGN